MKKQLAAVLLLFCTSLCIPLPAFLQGPQLVNLTPPSPSVQAFQKYGDIPVSAYTGVADISIPLYTIRFRDISLPISLSYHASGIKVAEEASNVGLGWVLNAAGIISRNVMGADDFSNGVYFNSSTLNVQDFSDGQVPRQLILNGCNVPMANKTIPNQPTLYNYDVTSFLSSSPPIDFQPDQYYYNIPGHSGKFIMKRNRQAILQKQDAIQISCLDTDGNSWQLKTAEGYTYDFTLAETYLELLGLHKSAWYLTQITSPAGNTMSFHYTASTNYVQPIGSYSETRDDWDGPVPIGTNGLPVTNMGTQKGQIPGKQYSSYILSDIDFTNGKILFNYSGRTDLPNDVKLDNITILNRGSSQPVKTIVLQYDYFNGVNDICYANTAPTAVLTQRLKLTNVYEKGFYNGQLVQNPPYSFTYNDNNSNPAKTSFARDHWGYFNGSVNKTTLIPSIIPINSTNLVTSVLGLEGRERDPNAYAVAAFSLTNINYPTGGWTEFQYESNDFDEAQSVVNDHSYFSTANNNTYVQTSVTTGYDAIAKAYVGASNILDLTNEWVSSAPGGGSPAVTLSTSFRFSGGTGASCNDAGGSPGQMYYTITALPGNNQLSQVDPFALPLCNATQSNSPCAICQPGSPVITFTGTLQLPPGKYLWQVYVGTVGAALNLQDIHTTFTWYSKPIPATGTQTAAYTIGGGLRIKRIIDHDGINEANNKTRHYIYHYWADKSNTGVLSEYSYGRRMSKPHYASFKPSFDNNSMRATSGCVLTTYYVEHLMRNSDSNIPLNGSAAGAVVGYDQVTELIGDNGEFGKKIYTYSNKPDVVNSFTEPFSGQNLPLMPPYGSNIPDPLNGSLLNEADYANVVGSYVKIKEVANQYAQVSGNENLVYGAVNIITPYYAHGDNCSTVGSSTACDMNSITVLSQYIQSEWTYLTSSDQKLYNQQGDPTLFEEVLTNFYYDNPSHLQLTRTVTTNSKGETITSTSRYPLDFTIPTGASDAFTIGVQNLQNKHMVSAPVEKFVQKQRTDGTNIGATSYMLTSFNSNIPTPAVNYVSMLSAPNTSFTPSTITSSGLVKDAAYQPLIYFDSYDAYGNITQQHKMNDMYHSLIWDYNNSLPIAEVSNAAVNEIAYTSFEADGTGGWTFTDPSRNILSWFTGNQSYTITTGNTITKTGLSTAKAYIVSYWCTSGALNVNGVAPSLVVRGNGWTYYQHLLPIGTSSITVSGNNLTIDDLRLYPVGALMTSYTYDPLVGQTSMCDPNGIATYYEYEGLGRLKNIKDWKGNIVKNFQYNYQASCGNNCVVLPMQTMNGSNTLGYPVGVFNINGQLLGNAADQTGYVNLWNADAANKAKGVLSAGTDALHFNLAIAAGQLPPTAVTGLRYYQVDVEYNLLDAVRPQNAEYIDFGDGSGMRLGIKYNQFPLPANTVINYVNGIYPYIIHSYPSSILKTLTFYHNDGMESQGLDNANSPAYSLYSLKNLRGNLPQFTQNLGGSSYHQASMNTITGITNWNAITSIVAFNMGNGDNPATPNSPTMNLAYPQDFMANNKNLQKINTYGYGAYRTGYRDLTFKISRLKSDWNSYFTQLESIMINEDHWNHEDLSTVKKLNTFTLVATTQDHTDNTINNPLVPIASSVFDNVFIQISQGAGQYVNNGIIKIYPGGGTRTGASDPAVNQLKLKGWNIYVDDKLQ